jgi:MoxR-like ATPase
MATHPEQKHAPEAAQRYIRVGASPRGAQGLVVAGKVRAILDGRFAVSAEDIRAIVKPTLRHRILRNFEGEAEGVSADSILDDVLRVVKESA